MNHHINNHFPQSLVFMITNIMKCCVVCSGPGSNLRWIFTKPLNKLTILLYTCIILIIPIFQSKLYVTVSSFNKNINFSLFVIAFRKNIHQFGYQPKQKVIYLHKTSLSQLGTVRRQSFLKITNHNTLATQLKH